ncbi:MAG: hypothetical protein ACP5D1_10510 [Bacteroidales bacterium]
MAWEIHCRMYEKEESNRRVQYVLDAIAGEMEKLIPAGPPLGFKPITVIHDPYYMHRIYKPLEPDQYRMGITSGKDTFGKAAYDFAHELMHIYVDPRIINWLTEILSHTASFYFMDWLAGKWETDPPHPELEGKYELFTDRKNDMVREAYQKVDLYQNQVSGNWIREEIRRIASWKIRGNKILYDLIALEVLPIFQENPEAWQMVSYVGEATLPPPPSDPEDLTSEAKTQPDFYTFLQLLPENLKPFGEKLVHRLWKE